MSSLTLTLSDDRPASSSNRIDMSDIVPDQLLPLSIDEIANRLISVGGDSHPLHEVFTITDGTRDRLILKGNLSRADSVGRRMRGGSLVVESSVGHGLARQMSGGTLTVHGNAGDHAGSLMRAGLVDIRGNVGDYCAGAMSGKRRGLCGGTLLVTGSAGRFVGFRMRRGMVIIHGTIEEGCASSMIAGTIVAGNVPSSPLAIGMRRGTLWCLTSDTPELHPGFTTPEPIRLSYLPLLASEVQRYAPEMAARWQPGQSLNRSLGDRASGGQGEVLWLLAPKTMEVGW